MSASVHRLAPLLMAMSCLWLVACGGNVVSSPTPKPANVHAASSRAALIGDYDNDDHAGFHYGDGDNDDDGKPKDRDNDADNSSGSYYDRDDNRVRGYGHPADAVDRKEIEALMRRYYEAAVAQDGSAACGMLMRSIAKSIPQDLGRPPGPSYLRGKTCPIVMSKVFKENSVQLGGYAKELYVSDIRVQGNNGVAVLEFKSFPGRQVRVIREGQAWRLEALLDSELP